MQDKMHKQIKVVVQNLTGTESESNKKRAEKQSLTYFTVKINSKHHFKQEENIH